MKKRFGEEILLAGINYDADTKKNEQNAYVTDCKGAGISTYQNGVLLKLSVMMGLNVIRGLKRGRKIRIRKLR